MCTNVVNKTSISETVIMEVKRCKLRRKSYAREFKLNIVTWFHKNGNNFHQTSQHFNLNRKQVRYWVEAEEKIRKQKLNAKAPGRGRKSRFPEAKKQLNNEFLKMRSEGKAVKRWWFSVQARQLIAKEFKFSDRWFYGFCRRHCISLRRKTHTTQKSPAELKNATEMFHGKLLCERRKGTFSVADIANMDQTPLPFVMNDGKTYNQTGSKENWCASGSSGLEKRQCTVQLTIFADGVSRARPLVIFRGKDLRIKAEEKLKWDKRVKVLFQKNAWCDEKMMKKWTANEWANYFTNPPTLGSSGKILVADVHRAQQTSNVKKLL